MTQKPPIGLLNFFVFNSTISEKEGEEHKKIVFYYPDSDDLDTKIRNVGLCEALIKFTETFSSKSCESLHTQKTRQIFLQPEQDFWMVMTLSVPSQQRARDGQVYIEHCSDEIQDPVYQSILKTSYQMFCLLNGTFERILGKSKKDFSVLKHRIDEFFSLYLPKIIDARKISDGDLLDVFEGIHFLPLEKGPFLKIQLFINNIEEKFSSIEQTVFLYSNQLVWSGLDQDDTKILYHYLAVDAIPSYIDSELKGGIHSPTRHSPLGSGVHFGRFMTGPKTADDVAGLRNIPKIYLNGGVKEYRLIIYRALNATVCMLIDENCILELEFFKALDNEIGSQLTSLASEIGEQYTKMTSLPVSEMQTKYMFMYFNHMNLAQKTTVHTGMIRSGHSTLPPDIMKLLTDFNGDLARLSDNYGEVIGKTLSDCWVIGKISGQREFYVVLNQKNANIVDVNEEMKKMSATHFQNIFVLD